MFPEWLFSWWSSSRMSANEGFPDDKFDKTHQNIEVNTYDCGGMPFKVVISPRHKTVKVFKRVFDDDDDTEIKMLRVVMKPTKYKRIFVGRGSENDKYYGNSVLFQLASDPRTYVFAGGDIYSFRPSENILSYRSDMGNSGVPYPFAVGSENTYLMIEKVFIPNRMLYTDENGKMGPYEQYYGHDAKSKSEKARRRHRMDTLEKECKFKSVKLIHDHLW